MSEDRRERKKKTVWAIALDDKDQARLERIRESLGVATKADVFRYSVALMDRALRARDSGGSILISDGEKEREIFLPGG